MLSMDLPSLIITDKNQILNVRTFLDFHFHHQQSRQTDTLPNNFNYFYSMLNKLSFLMQRRECLRKQMLNRWWLRWATRNDDDNNNEPLHIQLVIIVTSIDDAITHSLHWNTFLCNWNILQRKSQNNFEIRTFALIGI